MKKALQKGIAEFSWDHYVQVGESKSVNYIITTINHDNEVIYVMQLHTHKSPLQLPKVVENNELSEIELLQTLMIDSMPLGIHFWSDTGKLIHVNLEGVKLFGFKSKEDALLNFPKIFPKYQPDGRDSLEIVAEQIKKIYEQGTLEDSMLCVHTVTGEEIPVDIFSIRTSYQGKLGLITYFRDMREYNKMQLINAENEQKLQSAKEFAEQNAKSMGDFLANMSHEIRTPMNGILGLLHLLHLTSLTDQQKDYVSKILSSSKNLIRIINDILDFSKIEAGKLEMEKHPFTLQGIGRDVADLYGHTCSEKGLVLDVSCSEHNETFIIGDALRLKQVIFNLVSNAIKFTDSGGKIFLEVESSIHYEKEELHCTFIVSDTGIGLSNEQVKQLFSAFTQADNSIARKYGGTGLGLAISQRIVNLMGGNILVESEINKGTTFSFIVVFPLHNDSLWQEEQERQAESSTMEAIRDTYLLLVEDNEINQIVAREILQANGYTVHVAGDGQEALNMLEQNDYDAVLMDIQMPVMDGYTATRKIRRQEKYADLPIIAMSAHAMKGAKDASIAQGMNDHITKPIDPETLYKTLRKWIST